MGKRHVPFIIVAVLVLGLSIQMSALGDRGDFGGEVTADTDPPTFGQDLTLGTGTTGDRFDFNITVGDDTGVVTVSVDYWFGPSGSKTNKAMSMVAGTQTNGEWWAAITMPSDTTTVMNYNFTAADAASNTNSTVATPVILLDNDNPVIVDTSPSAATTGDLFTFSANVNDNIGVDQVRVVYWYGASSTSPVDIPMIPVSTTGMGNGTYELAVTTRTDTVEPINYEIVAFDAFGNFDNTTGSVEMGDNDGPEFGADSSDLGATTGDMFHIAIIINDNVGVDMAFVNYWFGVGPMTNVSMDPGTLNAHGNGTYYYNMTIPGFSMDALSYNIAVNDTAGNWILSQDSVVAVVDNDPPELGFDTSHVKGEANFSFEVDAWDNIGIDHVNLTYYFDGSAPMTVTLDPVLTMLNGNGTHGNFTVAIPQGGRVILHYSFEALDVNGMRTSTEEEILDFSDVVPPEFGPDDTWDEVFKGLDFNFSITVKDDVDVGEVHVEYRFGSGAIENVTMFQDGDVWTLTVTAPRNPNGPLFYMFHANDTNDNWNSTDEASRVMLNKLPVVAEIPEVTVTEGTEEGVNITTYLSDENDPVSALEIGSDAPGVTVDGHSVMLLYDAWMDDHAIEVWVTDGEDTVYTNISVTVINVNDDPAITSTPPAEGMVNSQYTYQVYFDDEDPADTHTYRLDTYPAGMEVGTSGEVTWTPSEGQEGSHSVDLAFSDGSVEVHQTWTIEVAAEDVNHPPEFTGDPPLAVNAGNVYTYDADASDQDGDTLTYSLIDGPTGATIDEGTGEVSWTTVADKRDVTEDENFTVSVSDGELEVERTFTVTVTYPVDAAPSIEGTIPVVSLEKVGSVDLAAYMSDPDDPVESLIWRVEGGNDNLFNAAIDGNKLYIQPLKGAKGSATVQLILVDPWGKTDSYDLSVKVDRPDVDEE
jgi:hypothetical protein